MNYLIILFGSMLGMLLLISAKSVYIQQGSKYELGFVDAFKVYTTKHTGPMVVGFTVILIAMFVFPTVAAYAQTDSDSRVGKIITNIVKWLRAYSVALGLLAQGLGFIIVRKGEKWLREMEKEKGAAV